jgi:hypothetical protein
MKNKISGCRFYDSKNQTSDTMHEEYSLISSFLDYIKYMMEQKVSD